MTTKSSASSPVDLTGRTALVTGANTGIGFETARALARAGASIVLACRSQEKADAAIERLRAEIPNANLRFLALDLGDLAATRAAAESFLKSGSPLHLLINNAGLAGAHGTTRDGFEIQFGTNHLGPYLFTRLLLPAIEASGSARIVNVSSTAHKRAKGIPFDDLRSPTRSRWALPEYCVSKLCNVLFTKSLAERLDASKVTTYSLHPGVIASDIYRSVPQPFRWLMLQFMLTNAEGARTSLHCATNKDAARETGLYYDKCKVAEPSPVAHDRALAEKLWAQSADWCGIAP